MKKAMLAYQAYRIDPFARTYSELTSAARRSSLKLDRAGNLEFWVPREDLVKLFAGSASGMALRSVLGQMAASGAHVEVMKHIGPLLGIATQLLKVYRSTQNERLAGRVGNAWNEKRFRKKVSMVIVMYAKARRVDASAVRRKYEQSAKRVREVSHYQSIEDSIDRKKRGIVYHKRHEFRRGR